MFDRQLPAPGDQDLARAGRQRGVTATGFALWIAYGILLKSWPLIVSNGASLAISSSILALKVRFPGQDRSD